MKKDKFLLTCVSKNEHDEYHVISASIHSSREEARNTLAREFLSEKESAYDSGYDEDSVTENVSADYAVLIYGMENEYIWEITKIR